MADELSAPLGRKARRKKRRNKTLDWRSLPWGRMSAGVLVLAGIGVLAWIALVQDPQGGRPVTEVPLSTQSAGNPLADALTADQAQDIDTAPVTPLSPPGGPSIITLDDSSPASQTIEIAEPDRFGVLPDLFEMSDDGPLPRVSPSGDKPYEAYARPSLSPQAAGGRKLIAVVVSGLGLSEATTREAINALPGAVTLAFAPYGTNLESLTAQARSDGHELMLEVPLEPFDYPQNDPGPHTLLVEKPPRENLEKLYWLLTRIGGYTGIINHMGARFTASAADFSPIMEELGLRGLAYLDDGSSNRSVAPQLARQNAVPFARVDAMLDANPSQSAIMAGLDALKATADENGSAIGILSALPVSIRTLSQWADALDENEYVLVPVSALSGFEGN